MKFGKIPLALSLTVLMSLSSVAALQIASTDPYAGNLTPGLIGFIAAFTLIQYIFVIRIGVGWCGGETLAQLGWLPRPGMRDILIGLAGALIAIVSIFLVGHFFEFWDFDLESLSRNLSRFQLPQRTALLLVGLNAAFIEESFFRGFIQKEFVWRWGMAFGIFFTSALFALYHLNFKPSALTGNFVLGVIFGLLRGADRSLYRPAIAHTLTWTVAGSM